MAGDFCSSLRCELTIHTVFDACPEATAQATFVMPKAVSRTVRLDFVYQLEPRFFPRMYVCMYVCTCTYVPTYRAY